MSPRAISIAGTTPNAIAVSSGDDHRERQHARVDADAARGAATATGVAATSSLHRSHRDGDAERRAHHGEQHALGEELPDQAAAARADRRAHRDFALAHGRAREQQARDVGAGDHQQERRRAEQREQRRAEDSRRPRSRAASRARVPLAVGRRVLRAEPRRQRAQLVVRRLDRSRPASAGTIDSMKCAPRLCCATSHVQPLPHVGVVRILKALRHHADDREQRPFSAMGLPTIAGSLPNRSRHSRWLMTAIRSRE